MATPPFLRYLPARLKPLGNPAIWAPLTIFTLVSAFIWEYHNNPDLFNRQPIGSLTPDSTLTSEEEARLSEIDNLDVLLEGSRALGDANSVTGQIQPVNLLEESTEATGANDPNQPATDSENPFAKYEAEYQFAGAANAGTPNATGTIAGSNATSGANSGASGTASSSRFNFGDGLMNPTAPSNNSALSDALNRQNTAREATAAGQGTPQNSNGTRPAQQPSSGGSAAGDLEAQPVTPAAGRVPVPFIRTTPNMSPPAGGTGYQAPATSDLPAFNVAPQQPTTNPYNPPAATQPRNQSAVPAAPSVQPAAGVSTPAGGTAYTPPTFAQPDQGRPINPRR